MDERYCGGGLTGQVTGVGVIQGKGSLVANGNPGIADVIDKKKGTVDSEGSPRLPRGMSITWEERLDLYPRPVRWLVEDSLHFLARLSVP